MNYSPKSILEDYVAGYLEEWIDQFDKESLNVIIYKSLF
jgi:hypothetical protein